MLKLFGSPRKSSKNAKQGLVETLEDCQPCNPYTEIAIFSHHTDIVRHLVSIDHARFASAGDDTSVVVWDLKLSQKLHVLTAHSRPITCLHLLTSQHTTQNRSKLLSAASDKLICIWDVDAGCLHSRLTEHHSTARCFLLLPREGYFCSGGEKLSLWQQDGTLVTAVNRGAEEDIKQMIHLNEDRLVLCVDRRLVVYNIREKNEIPTELILNRKLAPHREAIKCLLKINEACFASGSLDGTIILWSAQALAPSRYFNSIKDYLGDDRMYPHSIQAIICLEERYLICALGNGFCVYDIIPGRMLAEKTNAHYSKILSLALVYGSCLLASSSEDGTIRLWGSRKTFNDDQTSSSKGGQSGLGRLLGLSKDDMSLLKDKDEKIEPHLLGECLGHAGPVQLCVESSFGSLLTCGADGLVLAWKDGIQESMKRNCVLREMYHNGMK